MRKGVDSIAVSDLKGDATSVLKRVRVSGRPLVVTERGRPKAVLLSVDAYEKSEKEREILRLLARGEKEIAAGVGYDFDDVLGDAREILKKS